MISPTGWSWCSGHASFSTAVLVLLLTDFLSKALHLEVRTPAKGGNGANAVNEAGKTKPANSGAFCRPLVVELSHSPAFPSPSSHSPKQL